MYLDSCYYLHVCQPVYMYPVHVYMYALSHINLYNQWLLSLIDTSECAWDTVSCVTISWDY